MSSSTSSDHPTSRIPQVELNTFVRASQSRSQDGEERAPGHIFLLRADLILAEAGALLASVARVVLVGERGPLADQLEHAPEAKAVVQPIQRRAVAIPELRVPKLAPDVEYFNGMGGFADDGREYVTIIGPGQSTPAPWINMIANPDFGFQVSSEGGGYTWSCNAREHQLTPGPMTRSRISLVKLCSCATKRRAIYGLLRQSQFAMKHRTTSPDTGFGYSRFEHTSRNLARLICFEYTPLQDTCYPDIPPNHPQHLSRSTTAVSNRLCGVGAGRFTLGRCAFCVH